MAFNFGSPAEVMNTNITASSNPEMAADCAFGNNGGAFRRYVISASAASTISEGQQLAINYSSNFVSVLPVTGPVVMVTAQTTEASSASHVAFAAQSLVFTAAGVGQIIGQCYGPGKILVRGTGATASISGGALVSFAANSGYVVGAVNAVPASSAAFLYGRVLFTNPTITSEARTIGSATSDTALVDCYIIGQRFPWGIA